jgi:very-short-patch-repair endonuclease
VDGKGAKTDARIASLAAGQHGVITYSQLRGLGVSRGDIEGRARRGALHRVHQGAYAVGHPGLSRAGRYKAALLACGHEAVLSHVSAAVLWGLVLPKYDDDSVHVSLPSPNGRRRRFGIAIHRTTFAPGDLSRYAEIPVTTPNRTILDLRRSRSLEPRILRQAIRQAQHRRLRLDPRLKADRTRSDLEQDFRAFVRRHRLPPAEINVPVGPFTVDFLWRSRHLVVETDSYEYHHGLIAFEDDHERDLKLRQRGLVVLRYTGRQLEREPAAVAAEIRARLAS